MAAGVTAGLVAVAIPAEPATATVPRLVPAVVQVVGRGEGPAHVEGDGAGGGDGAHSGDGGRVGVGVAEDDGAVARGGGQLRGGGRAAFGRQGDRTAVGLGIVVGVHVALTVRVAGLVVVPGSTCVRVTNLYGWLGLAGILNGEPVTVPTPPVAAVTDPVSLEVVVVWTVQVMSSLEPTAEQVTVPETMLACADAAGAPTMTAATVLSSMMTAVMPAFNDRRVRAPLPASGSGVRSQVDPTSAAAAPGAAVSLVMVPPSHGSQPSLFGAQGKPCPVRVVRAHLRDVSYYSVWGRYKRGCPRYLITNDERCYEVVPPL